MSVQCEKGDVKAFFSATDSSTIRVQQGWNDIPNVFFWKNSIMFRRC